MLKHMKLGQEQVTWIVAPSLILVALVLKLINAFNAPAHWDTGLYLNIAVGYFERGILTPLMWRFNPEWNIVTGAGSGYAIYLLIGWVKLFGVSVLSGHMLMYLVGLINLPVMYLVAKRFYHSREAGLWSMTFFALSGTFAESYFARMDAVNMLACSLILLLHVEAVRRDKWWLHMGVGVALVAALEVHVLAALYTGGIGLFHAVQYLRLVYQQKRLVLWSPAIVCGIGLTLAAAVYFLVHIAPNPDLYFAIPRFCAEGICTPLSLPKEAARWFVWFIQQPFLSLFMFGLAVLAAVRRRSRIDQHYLWLLTGAYIALLILNPPLLRWYTGHMLPMIALGVGSLYAQGLNAARPQLPALRGLGYVLGVSAIIILWRGAHFTYTRTYITPGLVDVYFSTPAQLTYAEYKAAIDYIKANIPTDAVIVGRETFYLDLVPYTYFFSQDGINVVANRIRGESYFDLWQRERPQVFIGDAQLDPDIKRYLAAHSGFVEVVPKLWVHRTLLEPAEASS
jgi:hypothetical protein